MNPALIFVCNRKYAFDASDVKDKAPFNGLTGMMVDFASESMSGTDCVIFYYAPEVKLSKLINDNLGQVNDPSPLSSFSDNIIRTKEELAEWRGDIRLDCELLNRQCEEGLAMLLEQGNVLMVMEQERCYLTPIVKKGAELLIKAEQEAINYAMSRTDLGNWLPFTHQPYMLEKYGRVLFNCQSFLTSSMGLRQD